VRSKRFVFDLYSKPGEDKKKIVEMGNERKKGGRFMKQLCSQVSEWKIGRSDLETSVCKGACDKHTRR